MEPHCKTWVMRCKNPVISMSGGFGEGCIGVLRIPALGADLLLDVGGSDMETPLEKREGNGQATACAGRGTDGGKHDSKAGLSSIEDRRVHSTQSASLFASLHERVPQNRPIIKEDKKNSIIICNSGRWSFPYLNHSHNRNIGRLIVIVKKKNQKTTYWSHRNNGSSFEFTITSLVP
jgi:hypothetical protein